MPREIKPGCLWIRAWIGQCKQPKVEGSGYCEEHHGVKCFSCGGQANTDCYETLGPMVCGTPHCDKHRHTACVRVRR